MSPPMLDLEVDRQANLSILRSSGTLDCISRSNLGLKERNYLGLSDCSSVDSSGVPAVSEENRNSLNLKATELRLGLPGSQSPERDSEINLTAPVKLDEKPLFPLVPTKDGISTSQKAVVSGSKRGFSDTVDEYLGVKSSAFKEGNWMFQSVGSDPATPKSLAQGNGTALNAVLPNRSPGTQSSVTKEITTKVAHEHPPKGNKTEQNKKNSCTNNSSAPAAKEQVVGWPPIRSFRKNTLATSSKNNDEIDGKPGVGALFVKVSMDGAPYLRKVDLRTYSSYQEISSALEKMFSCFTIGQCGSQAAPGMEVLSESKLRDLLHGSEYVLTYEDKDGDWMLVGDVPWEMFIDSCKRLKIMKGSDAIGLAPRAMEKSKNRI